MRGSIAGVEGAASQLELAVDRAMACDEPVVRLLQVERLVVRRPDGWSVCLPAMDLAAGTIAAVHGPSGCGKSTVLAACVGLAGAGATVTGERRWKGEDLAQFAADRRQELLRRDVAFLMQDAPAALDPLMPVGRQVEQLAGCSADEVVAVLERLGVAGARALCQRLPHEVSGGQAQCVLLAVAFLRAPALVVADEPSAHLDADNHDELVAHLRDLAAGGSAVLLATHDHKLLRRLGADVLTFQSGAFVPGLPLSPAWPRRAHHPDIGMVPLLSARGITVRSGATTILENVDFAVHRGEVVAIVGSSGTGKTTLGQVLAGHRRPQAGSVDRPSRAGAVQLVCQDAFGSLTPGRTIRSLVDEARSPFVDAAAVARELHLGSAELDRDAAGLSGGERRRAALLRAIAVHPDVLVLDEPTAGLDRASALAVIDLLLTMQRSRGLAIVVVTHDVDLAGAIADRVVRVSGGRLCAG